MAVARRPSPSQLQALEDIERCGDPWARVVGMSKMGGWHRVMLVIEYRAKWARYDGRRKKWGLTAAGESALRQARRT
jgi:hypothetical protein